MKHHDVDFNYVFRALGCAIMIALILGTCAICSRIVPL